MKELKENENVVIYNSTVSNTKPKSPQQQIIDKETTKNDLPSTPIATERKKRRKSHQNNNNCSIRITPPQMLNIFARINEDDNFPEIQSNSFQDDLREQQISPSTQSQQSVCSNINDDPKDFFANQSHQSNNITEIRDEFAVYAEYVANSLRKFKDQHSVLVAQNKINNILFDAATGVFELKNSDRRECTSTRQDSHHN